MAGSGLSQLVEGPELCPLCDGPCQGHFERGEYVLGGPRELHPDHPDNPKRKEAKPMPTKRPKGKRRPAEDRAHHGPSEDR